MAEDYDIIIVGAGPAGLSAGLYASRARRKTLLLEKNVTGGQISITAVIENYPGIPEISGYGLGQVMQKQAEKYGMELEYAGVTAIEPQDKSYLVRTSHGDYMAKAIILTAGADYNRLNVKGEERLTGYGVSYCATCDAAFFEGQEVAVVGGGDSALDEGLFVTRYASKVTVVHRRDELRAGAFLKERAFANPKMSFVWNTVVEEINGEGIVESLRLRNLVSGEASEFPVSGVFIFIGHTPNTSFLDNAIQRDEGRHILVNEWMETTAPGIFAAGDVRSNSARQVITSAGDGATAAIRADSYITHIYGH